jgi:glutathione S-transferase
MRLFQIPFSHNCVKVRHVLDLKGLRYETVDINPLWRPDVLRASGQVLVPALIDGDRALSDSTPILLYLEEAYPDLQLLPQNGPERAECLVLMDWADATFMALTRRLAYFQVLSGPAENLGGLFFPAISPGMKRGAGAVASLALRTRFGITAKRNRRDADEARRASRVAVERLGERAHLVGDRVTLADVTLAAMSAPLQYTRPEVSADPAVRRLLEWDSQILGRDFTPPLVSAAVAA